ncbi:hypothetical protein ACF0H5_021959 [Mactra antiquata]
MKNFVVFAIATVYCINMVESCSCVGSFKDFMCSADFVAKVKASSNQRPSMNGPYQNVEILEIYKGRDDIERIYSGRRKPGVPMNSCEASALKKDEVYLLSGHYYEDDGDVNVDSVIISGCQVRLSWDMVNQKQFLFLEFLRDGVASECVSR